MKPCEPSWAFGIAMRLAGRSARFSLRFRLDRRDISPGAEMIARFLDDLEDTAKNPTWRPAELQAIDAPPALDYRTPDHTANAAKYMDLYGAKRRAEAKYAEAGPGEGRAGPQKCRRRPREGISRHPRGRGKEIGGRRHSRQPPRRSRKDNPLAGRHRRPSA